MARAAGSVPLRLAAARSKRAAGCVAPRIRTMKNELGDWTRRFSLCLLASEEALGFSRSTANGICKERAQQRQAVPATAVPRIAGESARHAAAAPKENGGAHTIVCKGARKRKETLARPSGK